MKLTLKNFRCHPSATFELPLNQLVLLSGSSGNGKTTIFEAFSYVLYGNIRKPITYGKTTCSVTLETSEITITRSTRPNNLVVRFMGSNYEKDEAQGVINNFFGMNEKDFVASSYVVQRSDSSVISFTPMEQLRFIQDLVFSDGFHLEVQNKVKECTTSLLKSQTQNEAEITLLESQLSNSEIAPIEKPCDETLEEVQDTFNSLRGNIQDKKREISILEQALDELKTKKEQSSTKRKTISQLETEIKGLKTITIDSDLDIEELMNDLSKVKDEYSRLVAYEKYISKKEQLDKRIADYFSELKSRFKELESKSMSKKDKEAYEKLEKRYEPYMKEKALYDDIVSKKSQFETRFQEILEEVRPVAGFAKSVKTITGVIQRLSKFLDDCKSVKSESTLQCPCCEEKLVFENEKLVKYEGKEVDSKLVEFVSSSKYEKFITYLSELENMKPVLSSKVKAEPKFDMEKYNKLRDRYVVCNANSELRDDLEKKINGKILSPELEKEKSSLTEVMKEDFKDREYYENLVRDLSDKFRDHDKQQALISDRKVKEGELKTLKDEMKGYTKLPTKIKETEAEIKSTRSDVESLNDKFIETQSLIGKVKEYLQYERMMNQRENNEKRLEDKIHNRKILENRLKAVYTIANASKKAEILSLDKVVESINSFAKVYLDQMFDSPIIVRLDTVKTDKKGDSKLQMNTIIDYKGHTYDNISSLSGGERQRVNLAFLLAVNDMVGSRFMFLDESLSALDSDTNTEVISYLKELGKEKSIFVISHEAVRGIFDKVIEV